MLRIVLVLIAVLIAFYLLRRFLKTPTEQSAKLLRMTLFSILGLVLLYFAATGRLNWLFALLGVAVAFIVRFLPILLRYAPDLQRLWMEYATAKQSSGSSRQQAGNSKTNMTITEAYEVLGLKPGASEPEIIAAHRKLMQKMHPDHGGSDYLAAKINLAKKILLKK